MLRCTVVIWLPRRRLGLKPSPEVGMLLSEMLARASVAFQFPISSMWLSELPFMVRPQILPVPSLSEEPAEISRVLVPRKKEFETTTSVIGEKRSR
jgi:hypothetical protein